MADQNQYFETEAERDAAVKAAIIAAGVPYNEDSKRIWNKSYIVGKPPATASVAPAKPAAPVAPVPVPVKPAQTRQAAIPSPVLQAKEETKTEKARENDIEARVQAALIENPLLDENILRARITEEQANEARYLTNAGSRDILSYATTVPVEYRTKREQGWLDAFSPQTSMGYQLDDNKGEQLIVSDISNLGESNSRVQGQEESAALEESTRLAIQSLRGYLTNDPQFATASPEEQRDKIAATILGIQSAPYIKQEGVGTGGSPSEDDVKGTFSPMETQGTIPDLSPEQMYYLTQLRSNLQSRLGADRTNDILGDPEWWQNEELKKQRLAQDPEFEGMLGLGVYRYPSGAVVESTPMYAMRMVAAPANFVVGGAVGLLQEGIDLMHPGVGSEWQGMRTSSEIAPAANFEGSDWSVIDMAFDNVKRGRGATEEIYDLGVGTGFADAVPYGRGISFVTGLGVDVLAVPIAPGLGVIGGVVEGGMAAEKGIVSAGLGAAKGAARAFVDYGTSVASDLRAVAGLPRAVTSVVGTAVELVSPSVGSAVRRIGDAASSTVASAAKKATEAVPGVNILARKLASMLEAPGDIRLLKASEYLAGKGVPPALANEMKSIDDTVDLASKGIVGSTPEEIAKAKNAITDRRLGRWAQIVLGSDPVLKEAVKGVSSYEELISKLLSTTEGIEAVKGVGRLEAAVSYALKESPEGAGNIYLLTNRVAVSEAKTANAILEEAANHAIVKDVQKALAGDRKALETIGEHLEQGSVLNLAFGNKTKSLREAVQTAIKEGKPLDRSIGRAIIETVTNDIALSGRYKKVISESNLENLSTKAQEMVTIPIELRPGFWKSKIVDWITASFGDGAQPLSKGVHSPAVIEAANRMQQELAALPQILNKEINEALKAIGASSLDSIARGKIIEERILARLRDGQKGATKLSDKFGAIPINLEAARVKDTIRRIALYNKPSFFFQNVFASAFRGASVVLLDDITTSFLKKADDLLYGNLVKVANGESSLGAAIKTYLEDVANIAKSKGLDISVVDIHSINEIVTAIIYDEKATEIQNRILTQIADETAVVFPKPLQDALSLKPGQLKEEIAKAVIRKLTSTMSGDPAPLDNLLKNVSRAMYQTSIELEMKAANNLEAFRALKAIEDAADDIIKYQKLDRLFSIEGNEALGKELVRMQNLISGKKTDQLLIHPQANAFIEGLKESSYDFSKLIEYVRTNPGKNKIIDAARSVIPLIQKVQYWFMLSVRSRFHGMNILTAPFIIDATLGAEKAAGAIAHIGEGFYVSTIIEKKIAARGLASGNISDIADTAVAVTSPSGKTWTWSDLADLSISSGIRQTAGGFTGGKDAIESLAQYLRVANAEKLNIWGKTKIATRIIVEAPRDFASLSDGAWRTAVLIDALKAGKPEMEAVQLAREALFDYGKATTLEKQYISSWFMYYSFFRASLANALTVLLDNPSRLANQIKATQGFNIWGTEGENERSIFYESGFMQSRPWLGSIRGREGKENYGLYGPPLPLVDQFIFMAKIIGTLSRDSVGKPDLDAGEFIMGRTQPVIQVLISTNNDRIYGKGYIDPRHVALLKAAGAWEMFTKYTGEPSFKKAKPGETAWRLSAEGEPLTYTFENDPEAIRRYQMLVGAAGILGLSLGISDYAPIIGYEIGGADPVVAGASLDKPWGFLTGAVTTATEETPPDVIERNTKAYRSSMKKPLEE